MDDPGRVRLLQRVHHGGADLGDPPPGQPDLPAEQLGQGFAFEKFHDDDRRVVVLDDVEQGDDARVVEPGRRPGLPHRQSLQLGAVPLVQAGRQENLLDRDLAVEHLVVAAPHGAHRALADHLGQAIPAVDRPLFRRLRH